MALRRTTDPTAFILTLAEARAHLHLAADFTEDDAEITENIKDAQDYIEDRTGRALTTQTFTLNLDWWPSVIELTRAPVASVSSVKYYDVDGDQQTLVSGTDYQVDVASEPGRIVVEPGTTWPNIESGRLNPIEVIYVAGYGALGANAPASFRRAARLLVSEFYEQHEEGTSEPRKETVICVDRILSTKDMPLV